MLILSGRPQWDLKNSPDLGSGVSANDCEDIPMDLAKRWACLCKEMPDPELRFLLWTLQASPAVDRRSP